MSCVTPSLSLLGSAAALGFAVAAPLGPTGATAIRHGLASGAAAAWWIGLGAATTDFAYIFATYLGLTPLLSRAAWLEPALYALGAVVLGRMGVLAVASALKGPRRLDAGAAPPAPRRGWGGFLLLGISVTILNPATITSWLSIGGAFVTASLARLSLAGATVVMAGVMAGSLAWFSILALAVGAARAAMGRLPRLLSAVELLSGLMLVGFGVVFAWRAASWFM